jgi:hypothetical protein
MPFAHLDRVALKKVRRLKYFLASRPLPLPYPCGDEGEDADDGEAEDEDDDEADQPDDATNDTDDIISQKPSLTSTEMKQTLLAACGAAMGVIAVIIPYEILRLLFP